VEIDFRNSETNPMRKRGRKREREREREERANNRILIESKFSLTLVIVRSNLKSLKTSGCGSFGHPYKE